MQAASPQPAEASDKQAAIASAKHIARRAGERSRDPASARSGNTAQSTPRAASTDATRKAKEVDQYNTHPNIAEYCYNLSVEFCGKWHFFMIEPSVEERAFFELMPSGSRRYDIDSKYPDVVKTDVLEVLPPDGKPIAVVGSPPFGRRAAKAIAFFSHTAL